MIDLARLPALSAPWLGMGEATYQGLATDVDGKPYALVLLGILPHRQVHQIAEQWAVENEACLPTRLDGALLHITWRDAPKNDKKHRCFWLAGPGDPSSFGPTAYQQLFSNGSQSLCSARPRKFPSCWCATSTSKPSPPRRWLRQEQPHEREPLASHP